MNVWMIDEWNYKCYKFKWMLYIEINIPYQWVDDAEWDYDVKLELKNIIVSTHTHIHFECMNDRWMKL